MPEGHLNGHVFDLVTAILRGHEVPYKGLIIRAVPVHLAGLHVFELGMVDQLLANHLSSDKEDSHDLKVWLLAEHADLSERVLFEAFEPLNETFEQVGEFVLDLTLVTKFLVVEPPDGEALLVHLFHPFYVTFTLLVRVVHEEGLEVVNIKCRGWQLIKWVLGLLFLGIGLRLRLDLSSRFSSLLLNLRLLLNGELGRLQRLLARLNVAEGADEGRQARHSVEPSSNIGHTLLEASIEAGLVWAREQTGKVDVCQSASVTHKPGLPCRQSSIDRSELLLEALDGIIEFVSEWLRDTEGGVGDHRHVWLHLGEGVVDHLLDLGLLEGTAAEEMVTLGTRPSDVLADCNGLANGDIADFEQRKLSGDVLLFVVFGGHDGLINHDDIEGDAREGRCRDAHLC